LTAVANSLKVRPYVVHSTIGHHIAAAELLVLALQTIRYHNDSLNESQERIIA